MPRASKRSRQETSPAEWTAAQAVEAIRAGHITAEGLVRACLERIGALEERIGAWTFLDHEHALRQARAADDARQQGRAFGPLHGVPVGIKDIFDTYDMPTEDGTVLHAGRQPTTDATAVARLREAGAVILGKTVTTELAVYAPGKTRNPHDPERTPGGSSSGSAAAVAANMVPLAIGTQTNGSIIRPAAYCGVVGFKPTHGLISRHGALMQSRPLDHVGVFARTVEDAALLAEVLMGYDEEDADMQPRARAPLRATATSAPPLTPHLAFVKSPFWKQADAGTKEAFAELIGHLGGDAAEVALPDEVFEEAVAAHRLIMEADLARSFARDYERGRDRLSGQLREMIERGRTMLAVDYNRAVERIAVIENLLNGVFERDDAIITPATTGEAPVGLQSIGSPIFCTTWTLCGMPAITLPLMQGENGMPLGVQLVGRRGDDARLLRTAHWLARRLG